MHGKMRPWCGHIGEDATRTAEHVVLNFNAFVNRDIVLHAHAIAYLHIVSHIHVLAQRATFAYHGTRLDMTKMPDLGACANAHIVIDITTLVYIIWFIQFFLYY